MVIACSKCQTRFHVDDARVPAEGVRVRCSKCKHSFFVRPPDAPADAGVHAAAGAAAEGLGAPEPSLDLDRAAAVSGEEIGAPLAPDDGPGCLADSPPAELGAALDDEEDWQFAIDPPSAASARSEPEVEEEDPAPKPPVDRGLEARAEQRRAAAPGAEPETSSLADLESPESWDLLGDGSPPGPSSDDAALDETDLGEAGLEVDAPAEGAEESHFFEELEPSEEVSRSAPRARAVGRVARALAHGAGWVALVGLLGALGWGLVTAEPAAVAAPAAVSVAGLEAREVRGRIVENALAGPLFVVTGTLANRSDRPRAPGRVIRVVLLDAHDRPLASSAVAGLPLAPRQVREAEPAELRRALERSAASLARRYLARGEVLPFQALFEGLEPRAAAFRLEDAPAPRLPPPTAVDPAAGAAPEGPAPDAAAPGSPGS